RTLASSEQAARACSALQKGQDQGREVRALLDWRKALDDPEVGLVAIATRHDSHAEIAAAALDAGKHVLLEKPVATTREGLDLVRSAHERHKDLVRAIGHNRRFSRYALLL